MYPLNSSSTHPARNASDNPTSPAIFPQHTQRETIARHSSSTRHISKAPILSGRPLRSPQPPLAACQLFAAKHRPKPSPFQIANRPHRAAVRGTTRESQGGPVHDVAKPHCCSNMRQQGEKTLTSGCRRATKVKETDRPCCWSAEMPRKPRCIPWWPRFLWRRTPRSPAAPKLLGPEVSSPLESEDEPPGRTT